MITQYIPQNLRSSKPISLYKNPTIHLQVLSWRITPPVAWKSKALQTSHWRTIWLHCKIWLLCMHGDRGSLSSIVDLVFELSLVNDSSANTAYMYWRSLWGQTALWWQSSAQAHAPAAKSDINKTKSIKNVTRYRDSRSAKSRESR